MRKILVAMDDPRLQSLAEAVGRQNHRTLVLWTADCAQRVLALYEQRRPGDMRPREALQAARAWARGEIKMPLARRAALASHRAATEVDPSDMIACAAARAMGHVVGTVHVPTHAMGFVLYALTAFLRTAGYPEHEDEVILKECQWLMDRLVYWEANAGKEKGPWAAFLLRDSAPIRE